jgi:hypothetical protein
MNDAPKGFDWDSEKKVSENVEGILKELGEDYKKARGEYYKEGLEFTVPFTASNLAEELINFDELKQSMMDADLAGYFD